MADTHFHKKTEKSKEKKYVSTNVVQRLKQRKLLDISFNTLDAAFCGILGWLSTSIA